MEMNHAPYFAYFRAHTPRILAKFIKINNKNYYKFLVSVVKVLTLDLISHLLYTYI
jgi:hypothetical protein